MTMHEVLHPKSDVDRVYLPKKKGGRGLISCEMCVKTEENNLAWYVRNLKERLMEEVRKTKILNSGGAKEKNEFKQDRQNAALDRWTEKKNVSSIYTGNAWELTKSRDETEAPIFAAQVQALRTNYAKFNMDHFVDSPLCRLCGQKGKTINHIIGECKCLARKEYKSRRHDNIARLANWKLCCEYGLNRNEKWCEHQPDEVEDNERCKILWDMTIQCDHIIEARRPDIVVD